MAVYEGVLRQVSGGEFHGRWSIREYIDVGEKHIRNVALTEYHAGLLEDAVGQEVALSVVGARGMRPGKTRVMAIWTRRRGVVKALSLPMFLTSVIFQTIVTWIFGIIVVFFVWGFASLFDAKDSNVANGLVLASMAFFFLQPLLSAVKMARARGALSNRGVTRSDVDAHPRGATDAATASVTTTHAPGWYDDSARPGHRRWWDGASWSVRDDEQPAVVSMNQATALATAPGLDAPTAASVPLEPDSAPPARFCENCGAERRPGGRFCTNCGHA